ncbi:hypothetical protein KJS94_03465 [Flavihumibacter rivuli]|uniref:hypothetical protein n=1 Tax=Flavihumibacter rivuli TaxID=2838156 RepID=UPI001BDED3C8|nr:hypothetical protein [Flavihumibacter rivuli]ULQ57257.1 hypothetical protein KJS94_03465 [Flavihumibacter rivuli]
MYNGLLHLHNLMRWVILVLLVVAILRHLTGMNKRTAYTATDRKVDLFLMISAHITLLVGLYQWFAGSLGLKLIQASGMGGVMKDSAQRYWAVEHMVGMIVVIILITIGRAKGKPASAGAAEHKKALLMFVLALLIILLNAPWPFREGIGRPWFPGM